MNGLELFQALNVVKDSNEVTYKEKSDDITVTAVTNDGDNFKVVVRLETASLYGVLHHGKSNPKGLSYGVRYDIFVNDLRMVGNDNVLPEEFGKVWSWLRQINDVSENDAKAELGQLYDKYFS